MAVKISELTASSAVTSNDFVPIVDFETTSTKRASASQILDYITGSTINKLQITSLTGSFVSGTSAQFTTITGSTAYFSGSVGIGTTTPSYSLDVNGAGAFKDYLLIEASSGTGNDSLLIFNARTNGNSNTNVARFVADAVNNTTDAIFKLQMIDADGGGWDDGFVFKASPGGDDYTYAGLGTTSPTARLDVVGNNTTAARFSSGSVIVSGNLTVTGSTTLSTVSGTTAQFTVVTASNISSSVGRFAQITSSNILINDASGNKIFAGTNGSSLTSPPYSFLPAESSTGITSISTNTVDILNNGTVNLSVGALGIVDVDKNIDYTTINSTSVLSPQTFDAASAHIARWSAGWTTNITANISNLANGRTFILYARNTNSVARTLTIQASATTTGHIAVDCSRSGAASVTLISLAANTGTATIWVSNVAGTFIGAIF